jgi:hypothetical protein
MNVNSEQLIIETKNRMANVRKSLITKAQQSGIGDPELEVDRAMILHVITQVYENNDLSEKGMAEVVNGLLEVVTAPEKD